MAGLIPGSSPGPRARPQRWRRACLHIGAVAVFLFLARAAGAGLVPAHLAPGRRVGGIDAALGLARSHGECRVTRTELRGSCIILARKRVEMAADHFGKLV